MQMSKRDSQRRKERAGIESANLLSVGFALEFALVLVASAHAGCLARLVECVGSFQALYQRFANIRLEAANAHGGNVRKCEFRADRNSKDRMKESGGVPCQLGP